MARREDQGNPHPLSWSELKRGLFETEGGEARRAPRAWPDAREVDRIEVLATVDDPARADAFLELCRPGSLWSVRIRTALVPATLVARHPLGSFDERDCTCLSLSLARPVPVEPGLRLRLQAQHDPSQSAAGIIRPWESRA
jgi:hypothetical protein